MGPMSFPVIIFTHIESQRLSEITRPVFCMKCKLVLLIDIALSQIQVAVFVSSLCLQYSTAAVPQPRPLAMLCVPYTQAYIHGAAAAMKPRGKSICNLPLLLFIFSYYSPPLIVLSIIHFS